ncbi:MAG: hypothetical protein JOZ41_03960 [Chloroflexi bacterium]|nr:hypothetical protein [Chloroflexota bacterium]
MKRVIGVWVASGLAVLGMGMAGHAARAATHTQKGVIYRLHGSLWAPVCDQGYDIENDDVVVRDQNNHVIGSGTTGANVANPNDITAGCKVRFSVRVPRATFYQLKIGSHDGPTYSFRQLQAKKWTINLSLS